MIIMTGAQQGASVANEAVTNQYQNFAETIATDQTTMTNDSQQFFTTLLQTQTAQSTALFSTLQKSNAQVSTMMQQKSTQTSFLLNYLSSITSMQFPLKEYLMTPILFDQLFTNSVMYAPQGPIWRNIFQIGNWQFDETTSSFWQMNLAPFASTTPSSNSTTAYQNFIFTEWTARGDYEIAADITLHKISYPSYVGIIFNKSRWISGDSYGIQNYRTLGIYAVDNQTFHLCYGQQNITYDAANSTSSTIQPLDQIIQGKGIQKTVLPVESFQNLATQPLTIHFKIKPNVNSVSYKIWLQNNPEPTTYLVITAAPSTTKTSNTSIKTIENIQISYLSANENIAYLYHGVGFISPGAIAQFKLNAPTPLLFSAQAVQTFTNDFKQYLAQQSASPLNITAKG